MITAVLGKKWRLLEVALGKSVQVAGVLLDVAGI
jgi:hypothetical protein